MHTDTYTHTYTHIHIYTHTHIYIHAYMHMHISHISIYPYIHVHIHVHVHVPICIRTCDHESSNTQPQLEWKCDASDQHEGQTDATTTTTTPTPPHHNTTQHHTTNQPPTLIKHDKCNTGVQRTVFMHVTFHDGFRRVHSFDLPLWFHSVNKDTWESGVSSVFVREHLIFCNFENNLLSKQDQFGLSIFFEN